MESRSTRRASTSTGTARTAWPGTATASAGRSKNPSLHFFRWENRASSCCGPKAAASRRRSISGAATCWSPAARRSATGTIRSRRWRRRGPASASPTGTAWLSGRQLQTNIERVVHVDRLPVRGCRLVLAPLQRTDHRRIHEREALDHLARPDLAFRGDHAADLHAALDATLDRLGRVLGRRAGDHLGRGHLLLELYGLLQDRRRRRHRRDGDPDPDLATLDCQRLRRIGLEAVAADGERIRPRRPPGDLETARTVRDPALTGHRGRTSRRHPPT